MSGGTLTTWPELIISLTKEGVGVKQQRKG